MLERLLLLQERGRSFINKGRSAASEIIADSALKQEIDALYRHYFGRAITGCKNCYCDALIELCSINKATAMNKTDLFVVRRGKVLKDTVNNDARLNLVRGNETVELALYHLYTNPGSREFFEKLPDDDRLDEMIAEYAESFETKRNAKHGTASGSTVTDKLLNDAKDKADEIIATAKEKATEEAKKVIDEATVKAAEIITAAEGKATEIIAKSETGTGKIGEAMDEVKPTDKPAKKKAANDSDPILK